MTSGAPMSEVCTPRGTFIGVWAVAGTATAVSSRQSSTRRIGIFIASSWRNCRANGRTLGIATRGCQGGGGTRRMLGHENLTRDEAALPAPARWLWQRRRRHGDPDHPRQAEDPLARPRVGAQERDGGRRHEPEEAVRRCPDGAAPRQDAVELPGRGG